MTLDRNSKAEDYTALFALKVGDVVKVLDYETVMERIKEFKPEGLVFELTPITPGTKLFVTYGCDHCIVTEKQPINTEVEETSENTEVSEETT